MVTRSRALEALCDYALYKSTFTLHYITRAREGRGISVAPEAQIEPEIETRPEQEIATCEEGLRAAIPLNHTQVRYWYW